MLLESNIIFFIILFLGVISFRTKKEYAIAIIPLLIPSGINILYNLLISHIMKTTPFSILMTYILVCVGAAMITGILLGILSSKFKNKRLRVTYLIMCMVFVLLLELIFIMDFSLNFSGI